VISQFKQKGFGLTENLIALVVLSVGLIAIYGVHTDLLRSMSDDKERLIALNYATEALADYRRGYLAAGDNFCADVGTYTCTLSQDGSGALLDIKAKVEWDNLFGAQSLTLDSKVIAPEKLELSLFLWDGSNGVDDSDIDSVEVLNAAGECVYKVDNQWDCVIWNTSNAWTGSISVNVNSSSGCLGSAEGDQEGAGTKKVTKLLTFDEDPDDPDDFFRVDFSGC